MAKYTAQVLKPVDEHRRKRLRAKEGADVEIKELPDKPEGMTWRDYVIMLLHIGCELEHGLMAQYLYAAYSLGGDHLSKEDQEEVQDWQELILTVAREEMGHLLTVQNLLCLLGGPVTFDRENFPWDSPFYPFPFNFEPLTRESLAAYVFAEMPGNFEFLDKLYRDAREGTDRAHIRDIEVPFLEETMKNWVEKADARPVGEVYHLVHDILTKRDLIPSTDLRPDSYPFQSSWDDWGRGYRPNPSRPGSDETKVDDNKANIIIERAATRTEALYAIKEICGQGENPDLHPGRNHETSHYARFLEVLRNYDRKLNESPDWNPARQVPVNPVTASTCDPENPPTGTTVISWPASAKWADLFNCRYRMLLTFLTHTYRLARIVDPDEPNTRGAVMHRIFGEMYNLKAIAGILVRMPLVSPDDPRRAGPPFRMPYSLDLPSDEIDCWRLHRDNIAYSRELCRALLDPANDCLDSTPDEGEPFLRTLCNWDKKAAAWVEAVLDGLKGNGGHCS
ncbi:MAG: hypothetical protein KDN19_16355 [Verrucomicrobiae bacterium]|nr:hypothetical protein [Verrucomicrobiae bacterium]